MSLTQDDVDYVRDLVYKQSAIVLQADKGYLVDSRLGGLVREAGLGSVEALINKLRAERPNGLHRRVVEALTTNETSFFRDVQPFEALRTSVLPELLARRAVTRRLTVWSAACSSGQEAYSIAMLLRYEFPQLASWSIRIIATDLSNAMVARTRAGRYSQLEVNRGLPGRYLSCFRRAGVEWQIEDRLRSQVEASTMNLATPWPPSLPVMDIIFLRNVLLYFDVPTKVDILRRARRLLRTDGALFLGGAETTLNLDDGFERAAHPNAGCYRIRATR